MTGDISSPEVAAEPKPKALAVEDDETMLDWLSVEQNSNASLYFLSLAAQHGYPDARRILAASQRHQK